MNPLLDLHRQAEAEFQPYGEIEIVSTFGEVPAEYAAVRKSCGLMDMPFRGVIELTGNDRLPFLNNLLSNQVYDKQAKSGLSAGQGVYAFLLNAKSGRVIAEGTPEEIARKAGSYTAEHLKPVLDSETRRRNSALTAVSTASSSRGRKVSGDLVG